MVNTQFNTKSLSATKPKKNQSPGSPSLIDVKNIDLQQNSFFITAAGASNALNSSNDLLANSRNKHNSNSQPRLAGQNSYYGLISVASQSISPMNINDRKELQAQRVFEAQERQKNILMKRYQDQKQRLTIEKEIEKKLKMAELHVAKQKRETHKKRMELMQKKDAITEHYRSQQKNDMKNVMSRIRNYEDEQK